MNSSEWDKFRKQQATEREQLQRLVLGMHGLLAKCRTTAPTEIELSALAALLHSFYTGVENIFKRVAVELDGEPVRGDSWHRELLLRMKSPTTHRPALLSEELACPSCFPQRLFLRLGLAKNVAAGVALGRNIQNAGKGVE